VVQRAPRSPAPRPEPPEIVRRFGRPDAIVASWAELRPHLHALYRATWHECSEHEVAAGHDYCADPIEQVLPEAGRRDIRGRLHGRGQTVIGPMGHIPGPRPRGSAWVATIEDGGEEVILLYAADDCDGSSCSEVPRDALLQYMRCGQLDWMWVAAPDADFQCRQDTDCTILRSVRGHCQDGAMAAPAAAPYRAALETVGRECGDPAAGACEVGPERAVCSAGRCDIR
jgi:hypothetical protein